MSARRSPSEVDVWASTAKTKHYRRIVITALAVGAVGVPSVALACGEWPYGTDGRTQTAPTSAPVGQWQHAPGHHDSNEYDGGAPLITVPPTPSATERPSDRPTAEKTAPQQKAPKKKAAKKKATAEHKATTVPQPPRTAAPGTPEAIASRVRGPPPRRARRSPPPRRPESPARSCGS